MQSLDAAFREGDFAAIEARLGSVEGFPNVVSDIAMGAPLVYAIYHGPRDLIEALLDAGADPDWPTHDGFPPVLAALYSAVEAPGAQARDDATEIVELLIARGADVGIRGINDYTPLHVAAANGDLAAVEVLLGHGADADAVCRIDDMETPAEVAARAGHEGIATRLRAAETDVDATDGYNQTALLRAAHDGDLAAALRLVERGADLDHTAKYHLSALMLAALNGHDEIARLLVAAGADTALTGSGAPGFEGKTAAELAEARGDTELAGFIRGATGR